MRVFRRFFVILICLTCAVTGVAKELWETLPETGDPVKDFAGLLSVPQRESLNAMLRDFHDKTAAGLVVVTVKSLEGSDVETFSNKLFNRWGVGEKANNKGVMLVIAKNDHRMRIECGYGAEAIIPDAIAKSIILDDITPRFKAGDFAGGIDAGSRGIMARFGYSAPGAPPLPQASAENDQFDWRSRIVYGIFFILFVLHFFARRFGWISYGSGGGWGGGSSGGGGGGGGGFSGSGGGSSGGGGASGSW